MTPEVLAETPEVIEVDGDDREVLGLSKARDRDAAIALASLMSWISEECYCAGWLTDLGFVLWRIVGDGKERRWGMGDITEHELERLAALRDEAGGWWHWPYRGGDLGELTFYTLDEWAAVRERTP